MAQSTSIKAGKNSKGLEGIENFKQDGMGNITGFGRRFVLMAVDNLGEERKRFMEVVGKQATEAIVYSCGKHAGMQASAKMRAIFLKNGLDTAVKHTNLSDDLGWGYINFTMLTDDRIEGEIDDCWEAQAYISAYGKKSDAPVCHFTRGFGAGVASANLHKEMEAIEIECKAMGHKKCKFVIVAKDHARMK